MLPLGLGALVDLCLILRRCPFLKWASWASSLIYALCYEGALFIKGILGDMFGIGQ